MGVCLHSARRCREQVLHQSHDGEVRASLKDVPDGREASNSNFGVPVSYERTPLDQGTINSGVIQGNHGLTRVAEAQVPRIQGLIRG